MPQTSKTSKTSKIYRIAFIEPDTGSRYSYIPLGLGYISAYIKKYGQYQYETQFYRINKNFADIIKYKPDFIAITAMTHSFALATEVAQDIKKLLPQSVIMLGGQHITAAPWSLPNIFDYAIMGEGEQATLNLIESIIANATTEEIRQNSSILYHNENNEIIETPRLPLIEPIDSIPFPDREMYGDLEQLITTSNFGRFNRTGVRWMQLTTARGCPYKCKFCQPAVTWKTFRMHSAEYVANEIEYIHEKYGITAIQVEDDLFTGNKKRLLNLIDLLRQKNLLGKIIYNVAARAEQISPEWVDIFKTLGVVKVEFGIEAGSDRIAHYWKGGKATSKINMDAVVMLNDAGIGVFGSFIAGAPDETLEELLQTKQMMFDITKRHPHNLCSIGLATPLPGTELWNYAVGNKLLVAKEVDWQQLSTLAGLPDDTSQIIVLNKNIPIDEIIKQMNLINRKMYLGTPADFIKAIPRRVKKMLKKLLH